MMDVRMTSFEMDDNARNRIVSEIEQNFFVEAGAGSGKTTMLVNRMVAMVEAGVDISRISAITFTKAAAGEFYDKFQSLLIERSNPDFEWKDEGYAGQLPEPTEQTRERCRNALQNIDLCFMGTIDAFCNMILSEHPYEAGILSDAGIMTDLDAAAFYRQQYVKICNGEYGDELVEYANLFQSFYRNPEEVFLLGAAILMDNRNAQFNYTDTKVFDIHDIDKKYASFRSNVIRALQTLIDHPELKYESEAGNLKAWEKIDNIYRNICVRWSSHFTDAMYGLSEFVKLRTIPQAMKHYGAALGPLFVPGGKNGKWLQVDDDELSEKLQGMQYDVTMTFLMKCVPVLEAVMRDNGKMSYFDYLYYLRNMLKKDAESDGKLIRYIYNRHSYFLIDEFQDTNPLQAEVFFYLTAEKPVPEWSECVPRKGSLFIVGDPKQSIYRFRSADVASFLRVRELFEKNGDEILTLTRNFRSTRTLCEFFNRVFAKMLPEETVNQSKFEEIPLPDGRPDEFQGVFNYKAYIGKTALTHPDKTDPVQIADIIERIVDREDYKLRGKDDKEPRRIRFSDIMVISYGKKKLGPIMTELDARSIPMKVEGDVPFADNEALQEIAKIYAAVADPYDRAALYGALTGKLIALTKEDLLKYRAAKGSLAMHAKPLNRTEDADTAVDETALSVSEQIQQLREFYSSSRHLSPAALFAKILEEYKVFAVVDADNLEVVYYTLELLRNAEKTGQVVTLKDGSRFINDRVDGISGEERCLSLNDDRDCVHMANLHKVKGLEAPVVILADAFNSSFTPTMRIQHETHGTEGYIFALESERDENGKNYTYCKTPGFSDEAEAESEALKAENLRLLYVAATRARNVLIICRNAYMRLARNGTEVETSNSKWKHIMEEGMLDFFETVDKRKTELTVGPVEADPAALYEAAEEECVLNDRSNEAETYTSKTPSKLKLLSKLTPVGGTPEPEEDDEPEEKKYSALIGTIVHKLMEELVLSHNAIDIEMLIDEIIREFLRPAQQHYEDDLRTILKRVAEHMRSGGYEQTNGLPKDILKTLLEADEVYCEVPFTYKDDENGNPVIWNGVIDVLYRSGDSWHIVDYKTNADGEALDEKYHLQMEAYAKALKAAKGLDADALTYHIEIGGTTVR